jgi:hypothetical protein
MVSFHPAPDEAGDYATVAIDRIGILRLLRKIQKN